jgi:hypothetical protein
VCARSKCAEKCGECNCESECRFERNKCKSETLGFVGLYWVELSVCIIPPLIYNQLPPWTYPVLGNHVNLLVCVLFVFAFGPVCATNWYQSIREARTLKKHVFQLSVQSCRIFKVLRS